MGLLAKLLGTDKLSPTGKNKLNNIVQLLWNGYPGQVLVSQGTGSDDPEWQDVPNPFYADTAGNSLTADVADTSESIRVSGVDSKMAEIEFTWNMDSDVNKTVPHGLDWEKIISITMVIRNDANDKRYALNQYGDTGIGTGITSYDATDVTLFRAAFASTPAEIFDSTDFNSTAFMRGSLFIVYKV